MKPSHILKEILKSSDRQLSLFQKKDIESLSQNIVQKTIHKKPAFFVKCLIRDKHIQLKPEEVIRQLYALKIIKQYGYPKKRLAVEYPVNFGREKKSADIVIFDKDRPDTPFLKVFGIDFDEKAVRVSRTLNLIAGDGETNILHLNTLDYERWKDKTENNREWITIYGRGFERLTKLRAKKEENKKFQFDLLMTNPPFAGDIKESRILHQYELGFKTNNKTQTQVGRDILFIERNLDFLKPGGRMAIVLPQGRFNNISDKYIREFISEKARILAVVGLHSNTFKPHTGTKTSVLFLQKWNEDSEQGPLCPKKEDYPIFFAVSTKGGKDNSGNYIYLKNGHDGQYKLDKNGHLIVEHDLHSHSGELPVGIAEAFIKWAKKEKLSFWI